MEQVTGRREVMDVPYEQYDYSSDDDSRPYKRRSLTTDQETEQPSRPDEGTPEESEHSIEESIERELFESDRECDWETQAYCDDQARWFVWFKRNFPEAAGMGLRRSSLDYPRYY